MLEPLYVYRTEAGAHLLMQVQSKVVTGGCANFVAGIRA
jgi:hypothetical protein